MSGTPRVLTADIETAPATALVFGQHRQEISNIQVIKHDRVLGVGAKWLDSDVVEWRSEYHHGAERMIAWARDLLDATDILVHYNGTSFDVPWLRRVIVEMGLKPPSPFQEVDLLKVVQKQFRYTSNKLENIAKVFGVGEKMQNGGFQLWRDIEVGDEAAQRKAWSIMRRYCKQDVTVEEALYLRLLPYIPNHPHVGLWSDDPAAETCRNCNSPNLQQRGFAYTKDARYPRFVCTDCGKWGRGKKADVLSSIRAVA